MCPCQKTPDHISGRVFSALGALDLKDVNRNSPVDYCCDQCEHWSLPLFSALQKMQTSPVAVPGIFLADGAAALLAVRLRYSVSSSVTKHLPHSPIAAHTAIAFDSATGGRQSRGRGHSLRSLGSATGGAPVAPLVPLPKKTTPSGVVFFWQNLGFETFALVRILAQVNILENKENASQCFDPRTTRNRPRPMQSLLVLLYHNSLKIVICLITLFAFL